MISQAEADPEKTRILLTNLMRAQKNLSGKREAKIRLKEQVEKLKKSTKAQATKTEIKELEKRLAEVLEKEEDILRHQQTREISGRRIKDRIHELEGKLSKYIEIKRDRDKRIAEIEDKIHKKFSVEKRQVEIIEGQLVHLEKLFGRISRDKKYTKEEISKVREKIGSLKKRLTKVK